ncbi:MAG: prolipoprotein diacylglyceryl transferase, partial [Clostridia bacterium]|nr:prolipoprotein diacylglyceryl transferase [Clostridia bacterium]
MNLDYHVTFPKLGLEFDLNSTALSIGDFSIAWYGVIIACGFLLAITYALFSCKKMNINADHLLDAIIV